MPCRILSSEHASYVWILVMVRWGHRCPCERRVWTEKVEKKSPLLHPPALSSLPPVKSLPMGTHDAPGPAI